MCSVGTPWPAASETISQLIGSGTEVVLNTRDKFAEELRTAGLNSLRLKAFAEDPILAENVRRINLFNLLH